MKLCNLDYLKSVTPGSNAFAIQMIKLFLDETPASMSAIKKGLETSNWDEVYSYAHKIKPSVTILGLPEELINALLKINVYSKSQTNLEEIRGLVELFDKGLNHVYDDLRLSLEEIEKE